MRVIMILPILNFFHPFNYKCVIIFHEFLEAPKWDHGLHSNQCQNSLTHTYAYTHTHRVEYRVIG